MWTDGSGRPIFAGDGYVWSGGTIPQSRDPFQDPNSVFYTPGEQSSNYISYATMTSQDFGVNQPVVDVALNANDWTNGYSAGIYESPLPEG